MRAVAWLALLFFVLQCAREETPLGEVLVVVDTDAIPRFANRLRLDLYDPSAQTWYESREIARPDQGDWPTSFSLVNPKETPETASSLDPAGRNERVTCPPTWSTAHRSRSWRSADVFGFSFADKGSDGSDGVPERIAVLAPFRMDKYEVTVGRFRDARGFSPPEPVRANENTLEPDINAMRECTFSATPIGRERFPLNCVSHKTAQAFCQFEGGTLPTEAQWEYVAQQVGREEKTRWPSGNTLPQCHEAIYARNNRPFESTRTPRSKATLAPSSIASRWMWRTVGVAPASSTSTRKCYPSRHQDAVCPSGSRRARAFVYGFTAAGRPSAGEYPSR